MPDAATVYCINCNYCKHEVEMMVTVQLYATEDGMYRMKAHPILEDLEWTPQQLLADASDDDTIAICRRCEEHRKRGDLHLERYA